MKNKILLLLALAGSLVIVVSFASCKTIQKKVDPNFLGDFAPRTIGTVMAGTVKRTKTGIKPASFTFVFAPRSNTLYMHHKFLGDNIWVSLDESDRTIIISAMKQYIDDYKNKNIMSVNNKKKAFYGKTPVELSWGFFGAARSGSAILRCEFELITNNRPYFILGNATSQNDEGANCPAMRMAFSPAQCEDIIEIMDQNRLVGIVRELQVEFDKYGIEEKGNIKNDIEGATKESAEDSTINYDSDF